MHDPRLIEGNWTFQLVEERLVEAWGFLCRMPDREAAHLRVSVMSIWQQIVRQWGDAAPDAFSKRPRLGLRSHEVDRMDEALAWVELLRPHDRQLVGRVLPWLARGAVDIPWRKIKAEMGWIGSPDALRMRYGRAINKIAVKLSNGKDGVKFRQPQQFAPS